jgi:hypothetical protein
METLGGFPNLSATVRARQSRAAAHAIGYSLLAIIETSSTVRQL